MTEPLYTRDILRLAASLVPFEPLARTDGEAELRSPTCGSRLRLAVAVSDGRVTEIAQAVEACAFGQASAAVMMAAAQGRNLAEARAALAGVEAWLGGDDAAGAGWPGLEALGPARSRTGRHGAMLLPFRALVAALEEAARPA